MKADALEPGKANQNLAALSLASQLEMKCKSGKRFLGSVCASVLVQICRQLTETPAHRDITIHPMNVIVLEDFQVRLLDLVDKKHKNWVERRLFFYSGIEGGPLNEKGQMLQTIEIKLAKFEEETEASQAYSLACLIYSMAEGIHTWNYNKKSGELLGIDKNPFLCKPEFKGTNLTLEMRSILTKMLSPNPPSLQTVLQTINLPDLSPMDRLTFVHPG